MPWVPSEFKDLKMRPNCSSSHLAQNHVPKEFFYVIVCFNLPTLEFIYFYFERICLFWCFPILTFFHPNTFLDSFFFKGTILTLSHTGTFQFPKLTSSMNIFISSLHSCGHKNVCIHKILSKSLPTAASSIMKCNPRSSTECIPNTILDSHIWKKVLSSNSSNLHVQYRM